MQFEKIFTPTAWKINGNFEGVGGSQAKILWIFSGTTQYEFVTIENQQK